MIRYVVMVAYSSGPLCGSDTFAIEAPNEDAARELGEATFLRSNPGVEIRRVNVRRPYHEGNRSR